MFQAWSKIFANNQNCTSWNNSECQAQGCSHLFQVYNYFVADLPNSMEWAMLESCSSHLNHLTCWRLAALACTIWESNAYCCIIVASAGHTSRCPRFDYWGTRFSLSERKKYSKHYDTLHINCCKLSSNRWYLLYIGCPAHQSRAAWQDKLLHAELKLAKTSL